jgi:hypothetical protein
MLGESAQETFRAKKLIAPQVITVGGRFLQSVTIP